MKSLLDQDRRHAAIKAHARTALALAGITEPPVDLELLASRFDDLVVHRHNLRNLADGLLRWNGKQRKFHLYYNPDRYRLRFNFAHELSHYLIDEHCQAIRSRLGKHFSKSGFVSQKPIEKEADLHASELLIPEHFLSGKDQPCFEDIDGIASTFDTSLQCAARRVLESSSDPAAMIYSDGRCARWGFNNEAFKLTYGDVFWKGQSIPSGSPTAQITGIKEDMSRDIDACLWVEDAGGTFWEEARYSHEFGFVLTILSA